MTELDWAEMEAARGLRQVPARRCRRTPDTGMLS